jgi:hypothetical protein
MKNISQIIERYHKFIIVSVSIIAVGYFGYQIFAIILNHISVGDTDIVAPSFDTISSYFKL